MPWPTAHLRVLFGLVVLRYNLTSAGDLRGAARKLTGSIRAPTAP